jgi:outer membrane protein OmpA-like peptidoglycan-associated protein/tetratricopeptide (TPR) repeat protein
MKASPLLPTKKLIATVLLMVVALTTYSQSAKEFLKKGDQQYEAKDFESALKTYKAGLKLYPDDAKLNLQTGLTYLSMPNKKESLTYLQTAFTLNPTVDPDIYYYLGLSYQSNHQYKSAEEFFTEYKRRNKKASAIADAKIRQSQFADSLTRIPSDVVVENIGKAINSSFHEYSPLVSADGNTMIFTSNRPTEGSSALSTFEDIYISKKIDGEWTKPTKISPNINIEFNDAAASLSPDGKTLVLYYEYGGGDIYVSKAEGENWTKPVPLNKNINAPMSWETSAFLSNDGKQLYFSSNREGGLGNLDIYISEMDETGDWGKANNLGPVINTAGKEDSPALDPDGSTLYFSSDGHPSMGGTDIFKSEFKDGKWQQPVNLGYPINSVEDDSFFAVSGDRRRAYFSTLREEGNAEIYTLTFIEPQQQLADVIRPESTVQAAPQVLTESQPETATTTEPEPSTSDIHANLSRKFLFFDIGKDILKSESLAQLEHVSGLLSQDVDMKILIEGHTDNTGNDMLNKALSIARANAVAKFLTKRGINPNRLAVKAYGATRPLVSNDDEREGREINRRIEISMTRSAAHASAR